MQDAAFWAVWAARAVINISAILLQYHPTFDDVFLYFHGQNIFKIRVSVHCIVDEKTVNYGCLKPIV